MSKIIAIANQKGGVGKTTTCINFGSFLAIHGKKVLLIDMDPQGNTSSGLGIDKAAHSIYDVMIDDLNPSKAITPTILKNLDIISSNVNLAGADVELVYVNEDREKVLKKVLYPVVNQYEFILIDCPPSLSLLTINAISAANSILIPMQGEFLSLNGLSQLMNTIRLIKKHLNPNLDIEGVLLTMFDPRSKQASEVSAEINKYFGKKVYNTKIHRNVKLSEAPSYGLPIILYDPHCTGARAYNALTEEFLQRNNLPFESFSNITNLKNIKRENI